MIMVSIGTFSWASLRNIPVFPKSATLVTFATVAVVVFTHNLALGVGVGVLLSASITAAAAVYLLGLEPLQGFLLGAVVASTRRRSWTQVISRSSPCLAPAPRWRRDRTGCS